MGDGVGVMVGVGVSVGRGVLLGKTGVTLGVRVGRSGLTALKFNLGSMVAPGSGVNVGGTSAEGSGEGGRAAMAARVGKMESVAQAVSKKRAAM